MKTEIISNGSKWAGEEPDSIETLLEVLSQHPLDRSFEVYGNFINKNPRLIGGGRRVGTTFFGNFLTVSHVFNINTTDEAVIATLAKAIHKNKQRPDYLAQPSPRKKAA